MKSHPDCANGCQYAKDAGVWPEHQCSGICQYTLRSDGPAFVECPFCGESDFDIVGLKAHLMQDCEKYSALKITPKLFSLPMLQIEQDTSRLDSMERNKWGVWFNSRHEKWVVQNANQTVGVVANGNTPRAAIDAAAEFVSSRPKICPACGCPIDADGCGCNPHDA